MWSKSQIESATGQTVYKVKVPTSEGGTCDWETSRTNRDAGVTLYRDGGSQNTAQGQCSLISEGSPGWNAFSGKNDVYWTDPIAGKAGLNSVHAVVCSADPKLYLDVSLDNGGDPVAAVSNLLRSMP